MSVRETVNAWFGERLATAALARDTEAYNQVFAALGDLIARLDPADVPPQPSPDANDGAAATDATAPDAGAATAKTKPARATGDAAAADPSTPVT